MENNELKENSDVEQSSNLDLTNEEKLEYLSKIIKNAEEGLESNDIIKKLVKKDGNL